MIAPLTFEANGQEYRFILDINALCLLEAHEDVTSLQALDQMGVRGLRLSFWAGLQAHNPVSLAEAGDLMTIIGVERATELVSRGYDTSMGPREGKPKDEQSHGARRSSSSSARAARRKPSGG